jgi:hypothetical protein
MDDHLMSIFKLELKYQCELAQAANRQLDDALRSGDSDGRWVALQAILAIAGNAAKLLWGSGRQVKVEQERGDLRTIAGVSEGSPLKSRSVRNAFEHFDEFIVKWHEKGDTDVYASRHIGQSEEWPPHSARFGHFNPVTGVITFLDRSASIPDLMAEFDRIYAKLSPA